MQLSKKAVDYIQSLNVTNCLHSNFLVSDLEKIIYADAMDFNEYYNSKPLSNELLCLIDTWNKLPISEDLFLLENQSNIKIIGNDEKNYSAIMVFPIYVQEKIQRSCNIF